MFKQTMVTICLIVMFLPTTFSQKKPFPLSLDGLPPIRAEINDSVVGCSYILLSTSDYDCGSEDAKPYNSSVQIIDPLKPYPPLWYLNYKCSGEAEITDAKILENGKLAFFMRQPDFTFKLPKNRLDIKEAVLEGYVHLDAQFNFSEFFASVYLGSHDYQVLPDGRRIYLKTTGMEMNLKDVVFKGKKLGSSVYVGAEKIEIMDASGNIIFTWNPLDHLSFDEMYLDEYADIISHSEKFDHINFSRLNSVRIDPFDGNLLISYNRLNACMKIDINTGKVLWRLGGKKSDFPIAETDRFYLQNDFQRIASGQYSGKYSLYSSGSQQYPHAEAFIFELNEQAKTARVVQRFMPDPYFMSYFSGNFEILGEDLALVNYADKGPVDRIPHFALIDSFKPAAINFFAPASVVTPRVTCVDVAEIKRPVISCEMKDGKIVLSAHGNFDFFQWSTGQTGNSITVADTGVYYVTGQQGIGGVPSAFFNVGSLEGFACPAQPSVIPSQYLYVKKPGMDAASPNGIPIELPFYHDRVIKGDVKIDFEKEYYIIKPLREN